MSGVLAGVEGLPWGYKFLGTDLCTDDHQGGRYRYTLGAWHEANPGRKTYTKGDCPSFPGDGLCVARTLSGAQSGGSRLGSSVMVVVSYRPEDVLCDSTDKVRVSRLYVHPEAFDPLAVFVKPEADLTGADLIRADLTGADLTRANLTRANLYGANLYGANLAGAYLYGANLAGAYLYGANLAGAYLAEADRPSWLPAKYIVTANGYIAVAS